jgi:L-iditol 2-dehydrogenase
MINRPIVWPTPKATREREFETRINDCGSEPARPFQGWAVAGPNANRNRRQVGSMPIPTTMKAVVLHAADDMRIEERSVPEVGPGEVLLKVNVASICGTDVKVLHRTLQGQPAGEFIMGHEYAGTVAALGPGVNEFQIGERVAVEVHKGCDRCENCIKGWYTSCLNYGDLAKGHRAKGLTCDGGFAEYAVNHINTLYRLPDNLTFEQACMVTTAASPLWAIDLMGGYLAGETVLVLGPGPIGLIAVQLCKALGAEQVILSGTRDSRLEIGKRHGADFTINVRKENLADRVREITHGKGADSVLECAGGPTSMQEALENVKRGGRIGVVAWYTGPVQVDMNLAVRSNVRIYAARGEGGMNCGRSLALMSAGKIVADPIITHHFTLDQTHEAFRTYVERIDNALKVVIHI